jgi:hypothetical protein
MDRFWTLLLCLKIGAVLINRELRTSKLCSFYNSLHCQTLIQSLFGILNCKIRRTCILHASWSNFASSQVSGDEKKMKKKKASRLSLKIETILHLEPPYVRCTVFWRLEIVAYSRGRSTGI